MICQFLLTKIAVITSMKCNEICIRPSRIREIAQMYSTYVKLGNHLMAGDFGLLADSDISLERN